VQTATSRSWRVFRARRVSPGRVPHSFWRRLTCFVDGDLPKTPRLLWLCPCFTPCISIRQTGTLISPNVLLDGRVISAFASTPASDILVSEFTCGFEPVLLATTCAHSPLCLACFLSPYWAPLQTASRGHCSSTATSQPGKRIDNRRQYLPNIP
jgi:hypothetical protein